MTSFRFRPPSIDLGSEIRWVLLRAFGPVKAVVGREVDPAEAIRLSELLDLSPRIAVRQGRERLADELGAAAAGRFLERAYAVLRNGLHFESVAREVAFLAAGVELPVVLLKFAALSLSGSLVPGSRAAGDLDVLAPPGRARELRDLLLASGYRTFAEPDYEHQLAGVRHPSGALVEVHTRILGVRVDGSRSADVHALRGRGLLETLPGFPEMAAVPTREVLTAHAVVHGLVQHGSVPDSYPAFRMLADVADLDAGAGRECWASWISRDVATSELEALLELCGELVAGRLPEGGNAGSLLRHFVAGVLDRRYAASLRAGGVFQEVTDHGRAASLVRQARHALFPSLTELDNVYGPVRTPLQRLKRRAYRPLHVCTRLARYGVLALRARI